MAINSTDSSSSPHFSQQRHFYLAVDRIQFKKDTLVDLLNVAGKRALLPIVVCCSSRDELDAVCSAVSTLPFISLSPLYSDLGLAERALILEEFRRATVDWNKKFTSQSGDADKIDEDKLKSHMIVETYMRRTSTCLAADGIVINMVVGGEVVTLQSIEESSNLLIEEMPINISEIL